MLTERLIHSDFRDLAAVQAEHEAALLELPNVVGVALGHKQTKGKDNFGQRCLTVLVDMKLERDVLGRDELVPATIGSVPTDVREVGILHAGAGPALAPPLSTEWLDTSALEPEQLPTQEQAPQREQLAAWLRTARGPAGVPGVGPAPLAAARLRPAVGGLSVGHYRGTAGTLGICCVDFAGTDTAELEGAAWQSWAGPHRFYLLSNNHVLANCNEANTGDPILQPAKADGGSLVSDTIGRLARFVPLRFAQDPGYFPINFVDAAIAEGRFDQLDRRIHWIGDVRGTNAIPELGSWVHMCGRTSFYASGVVTAFNATVDVNYPGGRVARFAKQIICRGLSTGGDSGAVVTDLDQRAVGLLFATSATVSVMNPIPLVEQLLGIRIAQPLGNGTPRPGIGAAQPPKR